MELYIPTIHNHVLEHKIIYYFQESVLDFNLKGIFLAFIPFGWNDFLFIYFC